MRLGKASGGCCRSASMTITASPFEYLNPAVVAISCPKFLDNPTAFTRLSFRHNSFRIVSELSVLPSSTKMTS